MKIEHGRDGNFSILKQGGTSVPGSWDDMLPAANEESWNGMTGTVGGAGAIIAAGSNADMFRYSVNVMDGLDFMHHTLHQMELLLLKVQVLMVYNTQVLKV